jgi:hypothetical protein
MRLGDLLFGVSFSVDQDTSMSVEADSRIGAWLDGVSAPRMPWLTAATGGPYGLTNREESRSIQVAALIIDCCR